MSPVYVKPYWMLGTSTLDVKTTTRCELVDITSLVRTAVRQSRLDSGLVCVFCPHTTAAVTIQENTDPNIKADLLTYLERMVPRDGAFTHSEENSDAHAKSSLVGASITMIVDDGRLVLGTWQGLFLCEFDGPRSRRLLLRVVPG